jgi:hypothetical protein
MTKKPKSSAVEIAEKNMPGWKAIEPSGPIKPFGAPQRNLTDAADKTPSVDAVMPSTRQLRAKFLGEDAAGAPDDSNAPTLEPDTELVDLKSGDLERTVGVNNRTGKIDWSQG